MKDILDDLPISSVVSSDDTFNVLQRTQHYNNKSRRYNSIPEYCLHTIMGSNGHIIQQSKLNTEANVAKIADIDILKLRAQKKGVKINDWTVDNCCHSRKFIQICKYQSVL